MLLPFVKLNMALVSASKYSAIRIVNFIDGISFQVHVYIRKGRLSCLVYKNLCVMLLRELDYRWGLLKKFLKPYPKT